MTSYNNYYFRLFNQPIILDFLQVSLDPDKLNLCKLLKRARSRPTNSIRDLLLVYIILTTIVHCSHYLFLTSFTVAFVTDDVKQTFKRILESDDLLYVGIVACELYQQQETLQHTTADVLHTPKYSLKQKFLQKTHKLITEPPYEVTLPSMFD